jgi:DNA polymerase I-like protein with 3'-5' exonuclease and polymerase domains
LFYGASIRKTAQRFGVEISEIMDLYEAFWDQFADVKVWQQDIISQFQELGYVQLFEGLRRHAPLGYGQQL